MKNLLVFVCVLVLSFSGIAYSAPIISQIGEPAMIGTSVVVAGEDFEIGKTQLMVIAIGLKKDSSDQDLSASIGKTITPPETPPANAYNAKINVMSNQLISADLNVPGIDTTVNAVRTLIFWAGVDGKWSAPYVANMPQVWFASTPAAHPGESIRLFGRNFITDAAGERGRGFTSVILKSKDGKTSVIRDLEERDNTAVRIDNYAVNFKLPNDLEPGEYSVFLHNGTEGAYGLSNSIPISILNKSEKPIKVVNVKDFGVVGDGVTDDISAINKAMESAAKDKGNCVVSFPAGKFVISSSIIVPAGVSITGSGKDSSTIINKPDSIIADGGKKYIFEDLGTHKSLMNLTSGSVVSDIGFIWDSSESGSSIVVNGENTAAKNITLLRIKILNTAEVYKRGSTFLSTFSGGISVNNADNFELSNSELDAFNCIFLKDSKNCRIRCNELTSRYYKGHPVIMWGYENCLIERNHISNSDKGFISQLAENIPGHGNVHNIFNGNCVEDIIGNNNSCETYLWEFGGFGLMRPVKSIDALKVNFDSAAMQVNRFVDYYCVVAGGRGLGQYRRIVSNDANSVTIDKKWNAVPDSTSTIVVMKGTIENILVNNIDRNNDKGCWFYGAGAIGNIVDRHISRKTNGIGIWTNDFSYEKEESKRTLSPDYFNTIMGCKVVDEGGIQLNIMGHSPLAGTVSSLFPQMGNRIIQNEITNVSKKPESFYWPHWTLPRFYHPTRPAIGLYRGSDDYLAEPGEKSFFNIVEKNHIQNASVGIVLSPRSNSTVLKENSFFDVKTPILDKGKGTIIIDAAKVEDVIDQQQDF